MGMYGPSVGEPGYLPYCGRCSDLVRMKRGAGAFECGCGLQTRNVNGEDMFDRTAPQSPAPPLTKDMMMIGEPSGREEGLT